MISWMRTCWGLAFFSMAAFLACIVKCGKMISLCVLSMTKLLRLMKCNLMMNPVKLFTTTKCSAEVLSPIWKLSVAVAIGFSNWPFASWIWKLRGSSILKILAGVVLWFCPIHFGRLHYRRLLSQQKHLLLGHSRNPEGHTASLCFVLGHLWRIVARSVHW